ncbi:Art7 [Symbiodinium natans]|uniref:Art7 protein n=1 Tax=Symbiodinium natans TaxID=878477 RepID=A0A812NHI3_9DINO|nr:Art7 [Symbiodinium natans]
MENVKEEAVNPPRARKPKLTHRHFFEETGLKKVIGDCSKIKFKGEGHEFEDLKVLMATYKKWFKEVYPFEDNFEDLIWKSRAVLDKKEQDDKGLVSNPKDELHELRLWYKTSANQVSKPMEEEAGHRQLDPETAKRVAENRARALERKRQREEAMEREAQAAAAAQAAQTAPDFFEARRKMMQGAEFSAPVAPTVRTLSPAMARYRRPAAYQSEALRALIGKRGRLPGQRVAVAGKPSLAEQVSGVTCYPLRSFANAEQLVAATESRLRLVRGWAVYERGDRPGHFVAERYWWNSHPDGQWVDLTPRPEGLEELLLVEAPGSEKPRGSLTAQQAAFAQRLLAWRFPKLAANMAPAVASAAARPVKSVEPSRQAQPAQPAQPAQAAKPAQAAQPAKPAQAAQPAQPASQPAKVLDYSKWSNIVDSDEEEAPQRREDDADVGVKDLAEGRKKKPVLPVPDFLQGSTAGGGGTNCLTSLLKMLDSDEKKEDHAHSLAQVFGRSFHSAMLDRPRQSFYKRGLDSLDKGTFVVMLGLGSVLPLLHAAKRGFSGLLLETSNKLAEVAEHLLKANNLTFPVAVVKEGLDNEAAVQDTISRQVPKVATACVVTERMAHDLLSNGIVPACVTVHQALRKRGVTSIRHLPKTVELLAAPAEIRSERLLDFDLRPFNTLRHTSSNPKADFWWWPVRMESQPNTHCALLGPAKTLCGFDFERSPEIALDEVRRPMKLQADQRGRCNCVAVWWVARFGDEEYSTRPDLESARRSERSERSEWKQAIHYLAGETSMFNGDVIDLLVSITPRFTFRMRQESPMSVEVPIWVQAPTSTKFSATLPILPYHFLMMTDMERAQVYQRSIRDAVQSQRKKLGRRPRVLDAGSGIGLLGMMAALEGAEVWLCEAVPLMRQTCREVVAANAALITEKRGLVNLLPPMMSTRLVVGEDVEEKFDIVVSEVMDLWCLGEGIIPTMRHAHKKLLAETGVMLPGRLQIFVQPLELSLWGQAERENGVDLQAMGKHFRSKFSAVRIDQFPGRYLTEEPIAALEVNLACVPAQPGEGEPNVENDVKLCIRMGGKAALRAKISSVKVDHSGMLSGYGIWWSADLGNGHEVTSNPSNAQRSWKQLIRWLDAPRFVSAGDDIQVLACYNDHQVNVEDIYLPREMVDKYQEELLAAQAAKGAMPGHATEEEELVEVD